jgi:hypothetical protein
MLGKKPLGAAGTRILSKKMLLILSSCVSLPFQSSLKKALESPVSKPDCLPQYCRGGARLAAGGRQPFSAR